MALTIQNEGFKAERGRQEFFFQELDPAIRYYSSRRRSPTPLWGSRSYPG